MNTRSFFKQLALTVLAAPIAIRELCKPVIKEEETIFVGVDAANPDYQDAPLSIAYFFFDSKTNEREVLETGIRIELAKKYRLNK